ncbi:hypothetical protein C9173_02550 [Escherichia coli]|nr:hypothetical protein [Escherichia coli]EFW0658356.1 hypothetical protein [Shigella dysenteriae]EFB9609742.1 hypothetical protein [Escherichia coli]EFW3897335.1 hypothetical protein [Shigella dysenteriae]EGD7492602.1 hypothetical protein [Shigella dysenteriae]
MIMIVNHDKCKRFVELICLESDKTNRLFSGIITQRRMRRERLIRPTCEMSPHLKIIFILARVLISDIN